MSMSLEAAEVTRSGSAIPLPLSEPETVFRSALPTQLGQLGPFPSYFQRYSCFSCDLKHQDLWDRVIAALDNKDNMHAKGLAVKYNAFHATNEICGTAYHGATAAGTHFKITLFKCEDNNQQLDADHPQNNLMVEFQRRYGCPHVYADLRESVRSQVLKCAFRQGLRRAPPLPDMDMTPPRDEDRLQREHVQEMLGMWQSAYSDQQLEGLKGLVAVSFNPQYRHHLVANRAALLNNLAADLTHFDEEVQLCAALLYKNLCVSAVCTEPLEVVETAVASLCNTLWRQDNSDHHDVYGKLVRQQSLEILEPLRQPVLIAT